MQKKRQKSIFNFETYTKKTKMEKRLIQKNTNAKKKAIFFFKFVKYICKKRTKTIFQENMQKNGEMQKKAGGGGCR